MDGFFQSFLKLSACFLVFMVMRVGSCYAQIAAFDIHNQSPESLGMAGTARAIAADQSAFFENPAGLSRHSKHRVFVSDYSLLTGLGSSGADWALKAGVIDGITEDPLHWGFLYSGVHTDLQRKDRYVFSSSFNYEDFLMLGVSSKVIRFGNASVTSRDWVYGIDLGALVFLTDHLAVASFIENIGRFDYNGVNSMPRVYGGGASLNFVNWRLGVDVERNHTDELLTVQTGIEYRVSPALTMRAGYFRELTEKEHGYSLGTSSELFRKLSIDFSFLDQLESNLRIFSLGFRAEIF